MHELERIQTQKKPFQRQQFKEDLSPREQEGGAKLFDLADPLAIEANRQGELTQGQRELFQQASLPPMGWLLSVPILVALFLWLTGIYSSWYILVDLLVCVAFIVSGVFFSLLNLIRRKRLQALFAKRDIEEVSGEVVCAGRRCVARSGKRRLRMVDTMYPLPLEGTYLFFVLAGTNYLLSAQSLDGSAPGVMDQQAGERLLVALSRANHFRLDELTINREGLLSDRQRARLVFSLLMTGIGGLLALAGIPLGVFLWEQWESSTHALGCLVRWLFHWSAPLVDRLRL